MKNMSVVWNRLSNSFKNKEILYYWAILWLIASIQNNTCWFHNQTEYSYSEFSTAINYLLSAFFFYKRCKPLSGLSLLLCLEEINYGQIFFSDLTLEQLNNDELQLSLHTQFFNHQFFFDVLHIDVIVTFIFFFSQLIDFKTLKIKDVIPTIIFILYLIIDPIIFELEDSEELIELAVSMVLLYYSKPPKFIWWLLTSILIIVYLIYRYNI